MNIYTKNGDKGTTNLIHTKNVSKSDDRIQLVGTIDELTSHLGLVKTLLEDADAVHMLESIQEHLITVMAGVADPYSRDYKMPDSKAEELEQEGVPYGKNYELGVMIETPAAVMTADILAREADFLCIGTNDLAQ